MYEEFIQKAIEEIRTPTFEVTRQYLSIVDLVPTESGYEIERVDAATDADRVAVYFKVLDERFFLVVFINKYPVAVSWVMVENGHRCYLSVTSENHSYSELAALTNLKPTDGWSMGEKQPKTGNPYKFSRIGFEFVSSEAYDLEPLLKLVLDELEKDAENVIALTKVADAEISIVRHQAQCANAGIHFEVETVLRLAKLNLGLDIDTYISGNSL